MPIRIRDIGKVEDGTNEQRSLARLNGVPTVILEVRRQSGANTVAVIEAVKQNMTRLEGQLPQDVKLEVIRDQSRYIDKALHEINLHLIARQHPRVPRGAGVHALVALDDHRGRGDPGLGRWRRSAMMWALDFTLNSVTMLALVLMVGIVIDDAIVVLENIFRFVEEKSMEPFEAARAATAEIGAGGARDDAVAGRDLRAGLVHVVDLGAVPVSVRHHGGGGGDGQLVRVVHADADDERAIVEGVGDGGGHGGGTAEEARRARVLRAARSWLYARCSDSRCGSGWRWRCSRSA